MRKLIIIFLVLFLPASCGLFYVTYNTYIIDNQTEYVVTILGYDRYYYAHDNPEELLQHEVIMLSDSFTISPYGSIHVDKGTGEDWAEQGVFNWNTDSVQVFFNQEKVLTFVCPRLDPSTCDDKRNIVNYFKFYEESDKRRTGYDYTYIITNEDFNNADVIE